MYNIYRNMYEAIGVKNIDSILLPPAPNAPKDPALENIDALGGKPFQAFPGQDHRAHITSHLNFMATNMVRNNPAVMAALQKNILEHISLMAQEQIQLEFPQEMAITDNAVTTTASTIKSTGSKRATSDVTSC